MARIVAFANQKGGVGKTTSCVNVAASLAHVGQKVLLVDLDPQGNATMGSGINKAYLDKSINDVLLEKATIKDALIANAPGGYDILPGNSDTTQAEVSLVHRNDREQKLKIALKHVSNYDFILIDCPPSLNMLTLNALVAADSVIIPMQCEYYALEGLASLIETIDNVRLNFNTELNIEGIIQTMYDPRNRLAQDVANQLKQHFPNKVYATIIPRNVRLAEAPSHGLPVIMYDKGSRGASAYLSLAGEIIERVSAKALA